MSELPLLEDKIPALIDGTRPQRLLTVGSLAAALAGPAPDAAVHVDSLPAGGADAELATRGHYDMAIIAGELETLGERGSARLLSQLRDLYAAWVIVVTDRDSPPPGLARRDLVALGFSLLGDALHDHAPVHVYEFDMATYKTTPDWLNSRYWANPELWDKHRW